MPRRVAQQAEPGAMATSYQERAVEAQLAEVARVLDLNGSQLRAQISALLMRDDLTPEEDVELSRLIHERHERRRAQKASEARSVKRRRKYLKRHGEPTTEAECVAYLEYQLLGTPKERAREQAERDAASVARAAATQAQKQPAAPKAKPTTPAPQVEFTEPMPPRQPQKAGLVGYLKIN